MVMKKGEMTMKKFRGASRLPRLPYVDNERGMILVLTMVIFLVLSSIAATNIINAYLEKSLAQNQHYATVSLNAADAGIDHGITWLVANPSSVDYGDLPTDKSGDCGDANYGWCQELSADLDSGGDYAVTISFKQDEDDLDADSSFSDVLYFNNCTGADGCFGFGDAVFSGPAPGQPPYPVVEVRSVGTFGNAGSRTVTLDLARNGMNIGVYGAITAGSSLQTGGNISIDGRGHDENGVLCSGGGSCTCDDGYPGITLPCPSGDLNGDGDCADVGIGETGIDSDIQKPEDTFGDGTGDKGFIEDYGAAPSNQPDEVLGMSAGPGPGNESGDLVGMVGLPPVNGVKDGIKLSWYNYNVRLQQEHMDRFPTLADSYGILIVHNPKYDPHVWDVSVQSGDPGSGYNVGHGDYDEKLDVNSVNYDAAYVAEHAPRTLDLNSNATFKGVVIADVVDKVNGNADIIGALVSLSEIKIGTLGNGSARIIYSCDAVTTYTTTSYTTKLAWHRRF
jgi:hypothetical protein